VQGDQTPRTWLVEVPGVRLSEAREEVDLRGVLDRLLPGGDVVVLEVPQRVEERVPLAARRIRRGLGLLVRACRRPPAQAGRGQGARETPTHEHASPHSRPSLLRADCSGSALRRKGHARRLLAAKLRRCQRAVRRPARSRGTPAQDRKSTRLNSSHEWISYAVFCLNK